MDFLKKLFKKKDSKAEEILLNQIPIPVPEKTTNQELSAECPYCHTALKKRPKRKKQCPHCGKYIFVKQRPNSETKELVTEEQAQEIMDEWSEYYARISFLERLKRYGFTEDQFNEVKRKKIEKGEGTPSETDIFWALFNERIQINSRLNDYARLSLNYSQMAEILYNEERNHFAMAQQSIQMSLLDYKKRGVKRVKISYSDNGCATCKKLRNKTYTIEEALKEMPIPNKNCTMIDYDKELDCGSKFAWCRCDYIPLIK